MFVLSCIHVNHLCSLYLYYFLVVVHRGPHGRLAFFLLNVLPSENKDYYYYYYFYFIIITKILYFYKSFLHHLVDNITGSDGRYITPLSTEAKFIKNLM